MKAKRKLSLAAGTIITVSAVLISAYSVGAAVTSAYFTGAHLAPYTKAHRNLASSAVANNQCMTCHRKTIPGQTLRGGSSAHKIHLTSRFLKFGHMSASGQKNGCNTCHTDVNTSNYTSVGGGPKNRPMSYEGDVSYAVPAGGDGTTNDTTSYLRKHVNPNFCLRCHGNLKTSVGAHGGVIPVGCANCHGKGKYKEVWHQNRTNDKIGSPASPMLNIAWVNTNMTDGNQPDGRCLRCHGSRSLYNVIELNKGPADLATP